MRWVLVAAIMTTWLIGWLTLTAWVTSKKSGDDLVIALTNLMIPFAITTCLLGFVLTPGQQAIADPSSLGLHNRDFWKSVHHLAIWLLFIFLATSQYLQCVAFLKYRNNSKDIAGLYEKLWVLTKIVPPATALTILLSGLRLVWQTPGNPSLPGGGNSMAWGYLQALIVIFSVLFFDGVFSYTSIVENMRDRARKGDRNPQTFGGALLLFLHFLSWPVVFVLGLEHPRSTTFLTGPIEAVEYHLKGMPSGWPDAISGLLLWGIAGVTFLALRTLFNRLWKVIRPTPQSEASSSPTA